MVGIGFEGGQFASKELLRVVFDGLSVKFSNEVALQGLFWIVVDDGWHLERVDTEVVQPFWVASHVDPGIVDGLHLGLFVKV